jgi:hypothetical protein
VTANDFSGFSVNGPGDINGDGYGDILIGAYNANAGAGYTYVVYGQSSFPALVDLSQTGYGFAIQGVSANDYSGYSVSGAGDVNQDGYRDFLIGAYGANSEAGSTYIVYGRDTETSPFPAVLSLATLSSSGNGIAINGVSAADQSGFSVTSAGDINHDGIADVAIGAKGANLGSGVTYIVYGGNLPAVLNLGTLSDGFAITGHAIGDFSGYSVSGVSDINGDGYDDIVIGAYGANSGAGSTYAVYGRDTTTNPFPATWSVDSLNSVLDPCSQNNTAASSLPVLVPASSGFSIVNNIPTLSISVAVSRLYHSVLLNSSSCDATSVTSALSMTDPCTRIYTATAKDYASTCRLALGNDPGSPENYLLNSILLVTATYITFSPAFGMVDRQIAVPLDFSVVLPKTLSVTSDVSVVNPNHCVSSSDCNGQPCQPVAGVTTCQCSAGGYAGVHCQQDIQPPTLGCPADQVVHLQTALPGHVDAQSISLPTVSDNEDLGADITVARTIGGVSIQYTANNASIDDLVSRGYPLGPTIVTYNATDLTGLQSTCSVTITILDAGVPSITCPSSQVSNSWASWPTVTATDAIDPSVTITYTPSPPATDGSGDGVYLINYTATDDASNQASCNFQMTYDTTPPILSNCPTLTLSTDSDSVNYATVTWTPPTVSDALSGIGSNTLDLTPLITQGQQVQVGAIQSTTPSAILLATVQVVSFKLQ